MPAPELHDADHDTFSVIQIIIAGGDYASQYVVWNQTQFESSAGAVPGTCHITLRDPQRQLSFLGGEFVRLVIDGETKWSGFVLTVGQGYFISDTVGSDEESGRRWDLDGVDLNILLDKMYIYNHDDPAKFPTGGGTYPKGVMPVGTTDREWLMAIVQDTDILSLPVGIDWGSRIADTAIVIPGPNKGQMIGAGAVLRAAVIDVAGNANKSLPGSYVFYIDPTGTFIYQPQDNVVAPFSVHAAGGPGDGVGARNMRIVTSDISSIKNDVLLFTTNLNPDPASKQKTFLFRHNSLTSSINTYGRWQYAENVQGFLQATLQARSSKILFQEGTPGQRASFSVYKGGLFPGQIVTVIDGGSYNLPIRQLTTSFETPNMARYDISASFNTQDPFGVISALRRPPTRGFVPPRFQTLTLDPGDEAPAVDPYTYVCEQPISLGGNSYQCRYGYIRYSIAVHSGGLRFISKVGDPTGQSLIFNETSPEKGTFRLGTTPTGPVYVCYHVSNMLPPAS